MAPIEDQPRGNLFAAVFFVFFGFQVDPTLIPGIVIATLGVGLEPDLGALSAAYVVFLATLGPIVSRFSNAAIAELPGFRRLGRGTSTSPLESRGGASK